MPRPRLGTVHEKPGDLRRLQRLTRSEIVRQRLSLLLLIQREPDITQDEIASRLGLSARTVKRWWRQYREKGLNEFIGHKGAASLGNVSRPAIEPAAASVDRSEGFDPATLEKMITFLNALPKVWDTNAWTAGFRQALKGLFDDIDHVSSSINAACDLRNPLQYNPSLFVHVNTVNEKSSMEGRGALRAYPKTPQVGVA